jgi:beta-phosphoglucomutase-like phosphatase (HAD superfamily)
MLPAPSASAKTVDIGQCLVFEDAPAGIRAGVASGAKTIAVCTSHSRDKVSDLGADLVIDTLEQIQVEWTAEGRMRVTVSA